MRLSWRSRSCSRSCLRPGWRLRRSPRASPGSALAPASAISGYDISWPQCGRPYPTTGSFGIVGVNNGIVYSANPCLADELAWAGGAAGELYANTANPGPALSTHWPAGQASPRYCDPSNLDSAACAYDYGYNAAADSFGDAVAAYASLGLAGSPAGTRWWLDVETSNSWRSDVSLNVAALKGAVGYLTSAGVSAIGFYSTQRQWNVITGGSGMFAGNVELGRRCRRTPRPRYRCVRRRVHERRSRARPVRDGRVRRRRSLRRRRRSPGRDVDRRVARQFVGRGRPDAAVRRDCARSVRRSHEPPACRVLVGVGWRSGQRGRAVHRGFLGRRPVHGHRVERRCQRLGDAHDHARTGLRGFRQPAIRGDDAAVRRRPTR